MPAMERPNAPSPGASATTNNGGSFLWMPFVLSLVFSHHLFKEVPSLLVGAHRLAAEGLCLPFHASPRLQRTVRAASCVCDAVCASVLLGSDAENEDEDKVAHFVADKPPSTPGCL